MKKTTTRTQSATVIDTAFTGDTNIVPAWYRYQDRYWWPVLFFPSSNVAKVEDFINARSQFSSQEQQEWSYYLLREFGEEGVKSFVRMVTPSSDDGTTGISLREVSKDDIKLNTRFAERFIELRRKNWGAVQNAPRIIQEVFDTAMVDLYKQVVYLHSERDDITVRKCGSTTVSPNQSSQVHTAERLRNDIRNDIRIASCGKTTQQKKPVKVTPVRATKSSKRVKASVQRKSTRHEKSIK